MGLGILNEIFARKREEVAAAMRERPLAEVKARAQDADASRGFAKALRSASGMGLIAEVKKASPSKGVIRADFDPVAIAQIYEAAGAHCLSVLTDRDYFQGAPEYLTAARAAVSRPVIRKDFLYDPYQVYESRAMGADAILLIVAMLNDGQIIELKGLAGDLGMDALIETHTEEEAARVIDMGATLIGVNNRNLADFRVALDNGERIIPMIRPYALAVAESAIETHADVVRMQRAGASAVLIGSAFTAAPDIAAKVREIMGTHP